MLQQTVLLITVNVHLIQPLSAYVLLSFLRGLFRVNSFFKNENRFCDITYATIQLF